MRSLARFFVAVVAGFTLGNPAWAGDDSAFTLVVNRATGFIGSANGQDIYVNGKYIGVVSNGKSATFSVPASSDDGRYTVRVKWTDGFEAVAKEKRFSAKAGDRVTLRTGTDWGLVDTIVIKGLEVETAARRDKPSVAASTTIGADQEPRTKPSASEHEPGFTLVVSRDYNRIVSRLANQYLLVNEKAVGGVPNGTIVRFSVPANSSNGEYTVAAGFALDFRSQYAVRTFNAKPGDVVLLQTGADLNGMSASRIRSLVVDPLEGPGKLHVTPSAAGMTLTIKSPNGDSRVVQCSTEPKSLETKEQATRHGHVRLRLTASHPKWGRSQEFVVFASPTVAYALNFRPIPFEDSYNSTLISVQYLSQLRACVLYHLGPQMTDTSSPLTSLEKDLWALRTDGVQSEVIDLRSRYNNYFRKAKELSETSVMGPLALSVLGVALQFAVSAYTQSPMPGKGEVALATVGALLSAGWQQFNLESSLAELTKELKEHEAQVADGLLKQIRNEPELRNHPLIKYMVK
jgi:hypothetical protein